VTRTEADKRFDVGPESIRANLGDQTVDCWLIN
jgi:hypothetical protein